MSDIKYPDNWLCKLCKKPFKIHLKKTDPIHKEDKSFLNKENWCYKEDESRGTDQYGWYFFPMDNLSFIEKLAKNKIKKVKKK